MFKKLISLILLVPFIAKINCLDDLPASQLRAEHRGEKCDCMDYWACANSGGEPYSYCGLDESSVCCILPETPQSLHTSKLKCGVKGFDSGKLGVAEPSEWPWHVAIIEDPGFYFVCSGSLVDEGWVMTAAHCVQPYMHNETVKLKARLGEHDVSATSESLAHEDSLVTAIILHPDFDAASLSADIALLRLQSPVVRHSHIDIICLPTNDKRITTLGTCILTGWGKTSESGSYSKILKEISIPLWKNDDCQLSLRKEFGPNFQLSNKTFCAGATGRDACEGDGGGPLICDEDGQWFQHGIVSYGFGCGQRGVPGVYTKVSAYQKWIQSTVLSSPGP